MELGSRVSCLPGEEGRGMKETELSPPRASRSIITIFFFPRKGRRVKKERKKGKEMKERRGNLRGLVKRIGRRGCL